MKKSIVFFKYGLKSTIKKGERFYAYELRVAINSTVAPQKKGLLGLFQKGKQKVTYVIANYESAETSIKKIEKDLRRHQQVLTKDIYVFDEM